MIPLAERMRPQKLSDIIGQEHLTSEGSVLHNALQTSYIPSLILWGPPGVGKTSIAFLIAKELNRKVFTLSAISAGVKDIREVIHQAEEHLKHSNQSPILFIDEIHRFNKSQQDSLLAAVEKGSLILIGATTENPSFEINNALLSRAQVYILHPINDEDLLKIANKIITTDQLFIDKKIALKETQALVQLSGSDARKLCNIMEMLAYLPLTEIEVTNDLVMQLVQKNIAQYDKDGELHYDIISAFIKSLRGCDPQAALYWLARMIQSGEDPNFICRRMVILAAEDIGLANPNALLIAQAAQQALHQIGWPEGRIILSEAVIYLACSPKSNSSYIAIEAALEAARKFPNASVPLHLRNAPNKLMKNLDYGKDYKYGHQFDGNFIKQTYLPQEISDLVFYVPGKNSTEEKILENLEKWKKT